MVSFYFYFVFVDVDLDDIVNVINCVFVFILYLLCEDSIVCVVVVVFDVVDIYECNIVMMEKLGVEGWVEMVKRFSKILFCD